MGKWSKEARARIKERWRIKMALAKGNADINTNCTISKKDRFDIASYLDGVKQGYYLAKKD